MDSEIERFGAPDSFNRRVGSAQAVSVNGHIYLSGMMATGPDGEIVASDRLPEQLEQALANVGKTLGEAGATPADIVSTHFYLTRVPDDFPYGSGADGAADGGEFERMCEVHRRFVGSDVPACTMLYVDSLPLPRALVQVSCVAIR